MTSVSKYCFYIIILGGTSCHKCYCPGRIRLLQETKEESWGGFVNAELDLMWMSLKLMSVSWMFTMCRKLEWKGTRALKEFPNSKYCVIFRNGKYLEKEIASHGTYTSYLECFDWYTIGTNKTLFPSLSQSTDLPETWRTKPFLIYYYWIVTFLNIISFVQNCRIIITAKYDGRFINFPPVGNINTFFFSKSGKEIKNLFT